MAASKCSACWRNGSPRFWERSTAPCIPSTKLNLLKALEQNEVSASIPGLKDMTVSEFKAVFRTTIRGERHPDDPTIGMTSLCKDELNNRLIQHGLAPPPNSTKGDMMLLLRDHWKQQCFLSPSATDAVPEMDPWELIEGGAAATAGEFITAREQLLKATSAMFEVLGSKPELQDDVQHCVQAQNRFLLAVECLLEKIGRL